MIEARHNYFVNTFFKIYTKVKLKTNFDKIIISNSVELKNKSILLISNHFSWWDGFWAFDINNTFFKKTFYFMMLEDQLKKHIFFTKTGGFSVNKKSRDIIESLNYAAEKLKNQNNLVLIFPQGEFQSIYKTEFIFEKGITKIIQMAEKNVQIIFLANLIEYYSKPKPSLFVYLKSYDSEIYTKENIQTQYNEFFKECISKNNELKNTL